MDKLWTNVALFIQTNYTTVCKNPDIARNTSACNGWGSALGALGRKFESCRPDSLKPSHASELPGLAFLFLICLTISTVRNGLGIPMRDSSPRKVTNMRRF